MSHISKCSIKYDPTGTDLEGLDVFAIAYVLELGQATKAHDLPLTKTGDAYSAKFQSPENAQVVFFKFETNDRKKIDIQRIDGQ